jgi:hypothetical protein
MYFLKGFLSAQALFTTQALSLGGIWNRARASQGSFPNDKPITQPDGQESLNYKVADVRFGQGPTSKGLNRLPL